MQDFKQRLDKLLAEAEACELIGSLAADPATRVTYRELALQLRSMVDELKVRIAAQRFDIDRV